MRAPITALGSAKWCRTAAKTGSVVWVDTVYWSAANESHMQRHGVISKVRHKKPPNQEMPPPLR